MKKQVRMVLLLLPLLAGLFSCGASSKKENRESTRKEQEPLKVRVQKAVAKKVPGEYRFPGFVTSDQQAQLSTKMMGTITWLKVKEGQFVRAGQELVRIKSNELKIRKAQVRAKLLEAEVNFRNVEKNYNRIKTLVEQNSATQKELDDISTQLESSKARIEAIRQMELEIADALSYASLKAPFSGRVKQKFLSEGDMASPGVPVLVLESLGTLKVTVSISEKDISRVKEGDQVAISIAALGKELLDGKVERISPSGNYAQGQFKAVIAFDATPAQQAKLKTGMYADVFLQQGSGEYLLIPSSSLVRKGQLRGVFTLNHRQEASLRWLRLGKKMGDQVEILSGLKEGEEFITACKGRLTNGRKVLPTDSSQCNLTVSGEKIKEEL